MLTEEEKTKYTAWLEAAEEAYNSLMTGGQAVDFTDQNGERIRYTAANASRLLGYINWLRNALGLCPFGLMNTGRPAGVFF